MTALTSPAVHVAASHNRRRTQRRTLTVLALTQVLGGAGLSTATAVAGLTAAGLSGSPTVGGLAQAASALGAGAAGLVLGRTAERAGRRAGLRRGYLAATTGGVLAAVGGATRSWPVLLVACLLLGSGTATTLAARFAATDLASLDGRGRALSVVLWATTVGAVAGPNLVEPARRWAAIGGLADSGPYLWCAALFGLATVGVQAGLRPDPLLVARADPGRPGSVGTGTAAVPVAPAVVVLGAQAVMVALMSMAPLHLAHGGAGLRVVGLTVSVHVGAMYAFSPLFGWVGDRAGRWTVITTGSVLMAASALAVAAAAPHAVLLLTVGLAGLGAGWSAVLVGASALLVDAVPVADRPRVQGRVDTGMQLGGACGGVLAGVAVAATSYSALAAVAAVVPVAVLAGCVRPRRAAGRGRRG